MFCHDCCHRIQLETEDLEVRNGNRNVVTRGLKGDSRELTFSLTRTKRPPTLTSDFGVCRQCRKGNCTCIRYVGRSGENSSIGSLFTDTGVFLYVSLQVS